MLFYLAYFTAAFFISEIAFRFSSLGSLSGLTLYFVCFSLSAAALLAAVCAVLPKKAGRICAFVLTVFLLLFYGIGLVYRHIFGSFLSISQIGMGGDAIASFWKETLIGIAQCWFYILLLLIPLAFLIWWTVRERKGEAPAEETKTASDPGTDPKIASRRLARRKKRDRRKRVSAAALLLAAAAVLHIIAVAALPLSGKGAYTPSDIYNDTFVLAMSQKHFGDLTSARLELRGLLFGTGTGSIVAEEPAPEAPAEEPVIAKDPGTAAPPPPIHRRRIITLY